MKETILITGAGPNGITGKLIKEKLESEFHLLTPSSKDLDLTNNEQVCKYFQENKIGYVIHCATFRPLHNTTKHFVDDILESNLRMYFALARQSANYKKMFYFGSGAEYDKALSMINIEESDFGRSIPNDAYGFGKYIMNEHTRKSDNIYNLRLFGTINPYERYTKNVISNICVKAIVADEIKLQRDCKFSFVDIDDVVEILKSILSGDLSYHDYNITSGKDFYLSDIAKKIVEFSGRNVPLVFVKSGLNRDYTGANNRIKSQLKGFKFTAIEDSLAKVYNYNWEH